MSLLRAALAGVALAVTMTAASAADLSRPYYGQPQAVQPTMLPSFTWAGLYGGVHAGYAFGETKIKSFGTSFDTDGFIGGLQLGYNWQYQQFVYGLEGSVSFGGVDGNKVCATGVTCSADVNWTGDIRARLGYSYDRSLLFVAAGLAFADVDVAATDGVDRTKGSFSDIGWTVGLGGEYAVTNNVIVGVEYKYSDFGKDNPTADLAGTEFSQHALQLRASYKF